MDYAAAQQSTSVTARTTAAPPERGVTVIEHQVKGACQHAATIEDRLSKLAMRLVGPIRDPVSIGEASRPIEPHVQDQLGDLIDTLNRMSSTLDRLDT